MASTPPAEGLPISGPGFAAQAQRAPREPAVAIPAEEMPRLCASLRQQVRASLARYHYENARFYAERLFEIDSSYRHLHLLAHTYVETGGDLLSAAVQLLELYYPFFPVGSDQGLSLTFLRGIQEGLQREAQRSALARHPPSGRADSVDLLSTDEEGSRAGPPPPQQQQQQQQRDATAHNDLSNPSGSNNSSSSVDVVSRWWCQYLFAVCCARRERFREGAKVLHELRVVSTTLQSAFGPSSLNARARAGPDAAGAPLTGALAALYEQDDAVDFFAGMEERLADVDYWLGFCTTRFFQRQDTSEYFYTAARRDPTLIAAFDGYTQHMREAASNCVEDLFSDAAFHRVARSRGTARGHAAKTDQTAAVVDEEDARGVTRDGTRSPLRRGARHGATAVAPASASPSLPLSPPPLNVFIRDYARVMFLQRTYRGAEVIAALDTLPAGAAPSSSSSSASAWSTARAGGGGGGSSAGAPAVARGERRPRSAWSWLQLGLAHFHAGQMEESAAAFDRAIRAAPWCLDDPALVYYSTALWQLRDESRLGSLAQFLVDKAPFSAVTLCVMANTYSLAKEPHDAVVMLERASQVDQTLAYAHCLRGYELLALGQREEASEAFKSALAIDPRHYMSFAGIGERCLRDEQLPEARNCFRLAIAINPLPAVMNRLTATYHRSDATHKELTDALALYERTIAQHPHNSFAASHQRADVLLRLGRVQEAHTALLALQRQRPAEAVVQVTLARCLQCMGDSQRAIMHYHRAMELDPRREGYIRCALERIGSGAPA